MDMLKRLIYASTKADWEQVVLNGGPPCFALMPDDQFCLRAERWAGHFRDTHDHKFVTLAQALQDCLPQAPSWDSKCCHPRVIMRPVNSDSWLSAMQAKQIEVRPRVLMRDLEEWIRNL